LRILIIFCCGILLIIGIASAVSDNIRRITATQDSFEQPFLQKIIFLKDGARMGK